MFLVQTAILFWLTYFVIDSVLSIIKVPKLSFSRLHFVDSPLVSIILPARNEEKYIEKCLESLLSQNYPNYEIIAINDESFDKTGELLKKYSANHSKIIYIKALPIPKGWTGKNLACYQGYLKSKGSILLFTDADVTITPSTLSLAVTNLVSERLDSITAIPKTLANDFWTKITLPILWIFSAVRFSPIKANNPKTRIGFFYGSFFMIRRHVYEMVGTHKIVSREIAEDAELGRKVKERGYTIRVFRGEKHIQALWSRNSLDLWHSLRRIIIPLYQNDKKKAFVLIIAPIFVLILPIVILMFVIIVAVYEKDFSFGLLPLYLAIISILLVISNNVLQLRYVLFQGLRYSFAFPLSGSLLLVAFVSSIVRSKQVEIIK
jgi:glycosyltransferase involved in cell wall biosynthesis